MKIFIGILFLLVNIVACNIGLNGIVTAAILGALCVWFILLERKRGVAKEIYLLELMCYVWSSSWRSFMGTPFASLPLPWFYIIGAFLMMFAIVPMLWKKSKTVVYVFSLLLLGIVPTIFSPDVIEALSFYITVAFCILIPVAIEQKADLTDENRDLVINSFVNATVIAGVFLIAQAVIQLIFNYNFVTGKTPEILGGNRIMAVLMFEDISSAMIAFAASAMMLLKRFNKTALIKILILVVAMALSSSRTGFAAFIIAFGIYVLFGVNKKHRVKLVIAFGLLAVSAVAVYARVRGIDSLSSMLDDSGRISGYIASIKVWIKQPIFGFGFSDDVLAATMGEPIPHFALLKILVEGGIIYFIAMAAYLLNIIILGIKSKSQFGLYALLTTLIGSCFIPSLFETKFVCIIVAIIMLESTATRALRKEKNIDAE